MNEPIEQIVNAPDGQSLWTPCEDIGQAQSFKVRCWRGLKKYQEKTGIDPHVTISVKKQGDEIFVVLTKQLFPSGAFMLSKEGIKTFLEETVIDPNREKMIRTMIEDKLPKEEILSYFEDLNDSEKALIDMLFKG